MDPLSQAVIGAGLAMSFARRERLGRACLAGALGGMAPDLDIFIRSSQDPLLAIEYHRHFTHALLMIPVVGAFVGGALSLFRPLRDSRRSLIGFAILGAATHGLLDACTSYGTQLYWPFSNARVAWNNVAIVDPIPTVIALVGIIWSLTRKKVAPAALGFACFVGYLGIGLIQRERAFAVQEALIAERGQVAVRQSVKPTIFNNIVFRSVYESEGSYFVDAIRVPWFGTPTVRQGQSMAKYVPDPELLETLRSGPQAHDLARFAWFSDDYLVQMSDGLISDLRYSMVPESTLPMWGIYLHPEDPSRHVTYWTGRLVNEEVRNAFFGFLITGS